MKKNIVILLIVISCQIAYGQDTCVIKDMGFISGSVANNFKSWRLPPLIESINQNNKMNIEICIYGNSNAADSILNFKRAENLVAELKSHGAKTKRINVKGFGNSNNLIKNNICNISDANERTEIVFYNTPIGLDTNIFISKNKYLKNIYYEAYLKILDDIAKKGYSEYYKTEASCLKYMLSNSEFKTAINNCIETYKKFEIDEKECNQELLSNSYLTVKCSLLDTVVKIFMETKGLAKLCVDVNQNNIIDEGDLRFIASQNALDVLCLNGAFESGNWCTTTQGKATEIGPSGSGYYKTVFIIPKKELSNKNNDTYYFSFASYDIASRKSVYYPAANFSSVYKLDKYSSKLKEFKSRKGTSIYLIGTYIFSAESDMWNFERHVKLTYDDFLEWEKIFDGKKVLSSHDISGTLFKQFENKISYIGEVDHIEKLKSDSKTGYEISVANIMKGRGIYFLTGGKFEATWTKNYIYDYSIPATMYYDNNTSLTGYWIPDNFVKAKAGIDFLLGFNENAKDWHYLGNDSTYQSNLEKLISVKSEIYKKIDDEITTNINNRNAFIKNNYTSISSEIKSEIMNYDAGNYKRYTIEFKNGESEDIRYYTDRGEWCVYYMFVEQYCYKDKEKALCRMYWDLTH